MEDDKGMALFEKEFGNKLFWAIWGMTLVQLALIIIETVYMIRPSLFIFISFPWLKTFNATETTTDLYLLIQFAYAGKKEISRFTGGKAAPQVEAEELVRRLRRGDDAVLLWLIACGIGATLHAVKVIPRMPAELWRTTVQVLALYTLALAVKTVRTTRRAKKNRQDGVPATPRLPGPPALSLAEEENSVAAKGQKASLDEADPPEPQSNAVKKAALLKFIKENPGVNVADCMKHCGLSKNRAGYLLRKLAASGAVHAGGRNRATTYTAH